MVGAHRFEYGEGTRHDPVLKRLFGFKRMPHFKAILRRFNKVTQSSNEGVMAPRLAGSLISYPSTDYRSIGMTRYGAPERAHRVPTRPSEGVASTLP